MNTTTTETNGAAASTRSNVLSWQIGERRYDVDIYDLDGVEWRDAKAATGLQQWDIVGMALAAKDFSAIAALVWVWRRRDEPELRYDDVLRSFKMSALITEPEGDADPPA